MRKHEVGTRVYFDELNQVDDVSDGKRLSLHAKVLC
jgi:hypothetical protein